VRKKVLYDEETYQEVLGRIDALSGESRPEWGRMSVGQMLAHCAEILEVTNGKPLEGTPWLVKLFGPLIRKMVVGDRPYPRGTRTHPQYLQTADRDFAAEKTRLLAALEAFRAAEHGPATQHVLFGKMDREEKGWSSYKHLDHHLTQFGV
jgi:hypothetical protein